MLPDETADQYEERIRTKRSNILLKNMSSQLEEVGEIQFSQMIRNNKKKMVRFQLICLFFLYSFLSFISIAGCTKVLCPLSAEKVASH